MPIFLLYLSIIELTFKIKNNFPISTFYYGYSLIILETKNEVFEVNVVDLILERVSHRVMNNQERSFYAEDQKCGSYISSFSNKLSREV